MMKELGFKSAHEEVHGKEPDVTYHGGLDSKYADPDPPACLDYIFFRGEGLEVTSATIGGTEEVPGKASLWASDHRNLVCDFKL